MYNGIKAYVAAAATAAFFVYQSHIFMSSLFLSFFCHTEYFSITLSYMLNETSTISNQGSLNSVNKRASLVVETVAPASLQQLHK